MNSNFYPEAKIKNQLNITSLYTFSRRRFENVYIFDGESHDFTEVVIVIDGSAGITADKDIYVLSAGELIIHKPFEFHKIWSDCGTEPEIIVFSFKSDFFPKTEKQVYSLTQEQTEDIKKIFSYASVNNLLNGVSVTDSEDCEFEKYILSKKLELFILDVINSGNKTNSVLNSHSAQNYMHILSIMEENISQPLTTKDLAMLCNMSVPTIEKTVYKFSGCGVIAYFNRLKMQKASEYIESGKNIKQTSILLGFANQNYFSTCFRKFYGVSPAKWRQK